MNYIPLIFQKFKELKNTADDFSFGELLYSILRKPILEQSPQDANVNWLKKIEDRDYYTAVEKALEVELEYKKEEYETK